MAEGCMSITEMQRSGYCNTTNRPATDSETSMESSNNCITRGRSRAPNACEVRPLVPMRRNPNSQYITLNIMEPTAMAPI